MTEPLNREGLGSFPQEAEIPTEQTDGPVLGWRPMRSAPRDRWIMIEGEFGGGDTSSARIGRWNPTSFVGLGQYEGEVFDQSAHGVGDEPVDPADCWNWYCEGRVLGWLPLPSARADS